MAETMRGGAPHLALVGGCGGIGRVLAARARGGGWRVTVLDLPASIARHPPEGASRAVDVTDAGSVAAAFDGLGPLAGCVNLAGFAPPGAALEDTPDAVFDETIAANLRGAQLCARAALPLLRAGAGAGEAPPCLVHVASGLAANVRPGYGAYAAAKAGLIALTKTIALEAAPRVRCNAVAPGAVDTAFLRGGTGRSDEAAPARLDVEAYTRATPLGRLAVPDDVVGPILFVLGAEAGFMTGQVLWVNGGGYMP